MSGFGFHDDITEDITGRMDAPLIDPTVIDWEDDEDVLSAADYLVGVLEPMLVDSAVEIAHDSLDGTDDSVLLTLFALSEACQRAFDTVGVSMIADRCIDKRCGQWLPALFDCDDSDGLKALMPDVERMVQAKLRAHATGEPTSVWLADAQRELVVSEGGADGARLVSVDLAEG